MDAQTLDLILNQYLHVKNQDMIITSVINSETIEVTDISTNERWTIKVTEQ